MVAWMAGAFVVSGCGAGGSSPASTAADAAFISAVHLSAPDVNTYRTDTQLIRLGHAACDGFDSGASYQQLADRMTLQEGSNPLPSEDLGAVITAAADAYCPKFRGQVS
jgi:hypothetical protein